MYTNVKTLGVTIMNFNNTNDSYFEQIVRIKKTAKTTLAIIGIWLLTLIVTFILFMIPALASIVIFLCFGIAYGAYWLCTKFNVEFEYIITNGWMDIDKIINKSSRKRITGFDLSNVVRLEKYNPALISNMNKKDVVFACCEDDENAYLLVAEREGKGNAVVVFSPNEKIKTAVMKFAPKFITNSAFKD